MMFTARSFGKIGLFSVVIGMAFVTAADAQAGDKATKITLEKGKASIDGNMTANEEKYTLRMTLGKSYTISMTARFDTYLRLRDKDGKQIAYDDDGGDKLNSRLVFQPFKTDDYTIVATSFGESGRGAYQLQISEDPGPTAATLKNGRFSVTGNLKSEVEYFILKAKKGQRFVINMTSRKFDTYIKVISAGKKIAEDDDSGDGLNSKLIFNVPEDGAFFVGATSFSKAGRGEYELSIVLDQ